MDTSIADEVKIRRKRTILGYTLVSVALLAGCLLLFRRWFASTVDRSAITIAVVEKGDMENTLTASGEVFPEFEETITCPINASIQKIFMEEGSRVKPGESVVLLDKSASLADYAKLRFQLETKQKEIEKLRLDLSKSFYDIQSNNTIKQLSITSFSADVENAKRLYAAGGGTKADIEKAELSLNVAQLEKQQLENEVRNKQKTMQLEIKEAELSASIEEKDLGELGRKLLLADITSRRGGVVTWVNKSIGAAVREGDALARIADLSSFKVRGTITDNYLSELHTGMAAIIRINDVQLRGTVVNIQPSVQNGIVTFDVRLEERENKLLRPNLKVDVFLVTSSRPQVLRVANGQAFRGGVTQGVFVVTGDKAQKRELQIGMTNFDFVELSGNIRAGERVITSDMSGFQQVNEVTIKNPLP